MEKKSLKNRIWWGYLEEDLQGLLNESNLLLERVENWKEKFHDYAFVIFPAAKAYEGFLKKLFLDMGFIDEKKYKGKRFRIGKALNPALDTRYRKHEGVYDKIVTFCGGRELADRLWYTWKNCRNVLFHWFPEEKNAISFSEAKERYGMIIEAIDTSFKECKIDS